MPVQTTQSKVNLVGALRSHAKDETTYGQDFTNLPGGISNGIAELVEAKRGVYGQGTKKAGKEYILLQGSVVSPVTITDRMPIFKAGANGRGAIEYAPDREASIKGLFTRQFLDLGSTGRKDANGNAIEVSAEDNVKITLNELRKLGGDDCTDALASLPPTATEDQAKKVLDAILDALKKARIRFKFSTRYSKPSSQYPTPMVFENWQGAATMDPESNGHDPSAGFVDSSEQVPEDTTPSDPVADIQELDGLLLRVKDGDEEAGAKLRELALEAGVTEEQWDAESDWDEAVKLIEAAREGGGTAPDEPQEFVPVKGTVYLYQVLDPKTKKPLIDTKTKKARKPIEVEVTAVDAKAKTVDLLSQVDKKSRYPKVSWDALIVE